MPPFGFWDFGSSLLSLLWILSHVGCLFPLYLFNLVGFYLTPSSVTYFLLSHIFSFGGWNYVPVLLVVWPEGSSTGVCGLLGRAGSWCWDEDLWKASLQWIFPGVWGSLLVQWFRLGAPTTGAQAQPLACEPRSCKLWGVAKNKTKQNKKSRTITEQKLNKIRKLTDMLEKIKYKWNNDGR